VHRLTIGGAADVAEAGAAHHAAGGLDGMIHRGQNSLPRFAGVDRGVVQQLLAEILFRRAGHRRTRCDGGVGPIKHGGVRAQQTEVLAFNHGEAAAFGTGQLNESHITQ